MSVRRVHSSGVALGCVSLKGGLSRNESRRGRGVLAARTADRFGSLNHACRLAGAPTCAPGKSRSSLNAALIFVPSPGRRKDVLVRVAAAAGLLIFPVATWAQAIAVPGVVGDIEYMKCRQRICGSATRIDSCLGQTAGGACTFCTGNQLVKMCRPGGSGCTQVGSAAYGDQVSGTCNANGVCTGNQIVGVYSVVKCITST